MQWKNRKLPFFAYRGFAQEAILLITSYKDDWFRTSHVINVEFNTIPFAILYKDSGRVSKTILEKEFKEINELSQEQRRMAFISILDNFEVVN